MVTDTAAIIWAPYLTACWRSGPAWSATPGTSPCGYPQASSYWPRSWPGYAACLSGPDPGPASHRHDSTETSEPGATRPTGTPNRRNTTPPHRTLTPFAIYSLVVGIICILRFA